MPPCDSKKKQKHTLLLKIKFSCFPSLLSQVYCFPVGARKSYDKIFKLLNLLFSSLITKKTTRLLKIHAPILYIFLHQGVKNRFSWKHLPSESFALKANQFLFLMTQIFTMVTGQSGPLKSCSLLSLSNKHPFLLVDFIVRGPNTSREY